MTMIVPESTLMVFTWTSNDHSDENFRILRRVFRHEKAANIRFYANVH